MPRLRLTSAVALVAILAVLTACSSKKSPSASNLPDGNALLSASADQMRALKTTKFNITADGSIAGLALRRADGVLTKEGSAQGTAQVEQFGAAVELSFVIVGDKIYLKGPTGGYTTLPLALASTIYDPSAILDPERGIAKVLSTAKNGKTEAEESVNGRDAYRVSAAIDGAVLATIVPGTKGEVPARLWIGKDPKHLLKATFTLAGDGSSAPGSVTIVFSDFDAPVTINAPS
jgi:lipoprotein LprG